MKSDGVKHDPCGPPRLILIHLDRTPFISMKPRLFSHHDLIHLTYERGIPILRNFPIHPSIHSLSKALLKSTKTVATGDEFDIKDDICSTKSSTLV